MLRLILVLLIPLVWIVSGSSGEPVWPQWRGPSSTGVAPGANPPVQWSDTENVRWKTALPGRGHSSPIVWGDRIFVTTAVADGDKLTPKMSGRPGEHDNLPIDSAHRYVVIAIDPADGSIVWEKTVHRSVPHEGGHYTASLASASPVTDGQHVYAFFGSHGLYCLDFAGDVVWQKQLGKMHTKHGHGEGASPALHGDTLVVNWDHEEQSFLVALDKKTGAEIWRRERQEVTSWSSPLIVQQDGVTQAIVCGTDRVRGYDLSTGETIWQCGGMSANIVATPVSADGMLYVGSSYEKRALMAINLAGARGDITDSSHVLWSRSRGTPYVPSPLLYDGALYFLMHYQNVMTRVSAKSGIDDPGAIRLGELGNIYASPVGAGGHVYVTDLDGVTQVMTNSAIPRSVAVNPLGEKVSASAAIVADAIYLRGHRHLFCIAAD
ncbi:MAG: PQQ-like beta-propeller repeat protein [Pirellulaceae bacterium]|nr:PQQ-like beta-propeller repeat protein [Pirellulaceae bacterium]